ncbi:MAG: PDZ domain-containing protein [Bacteroidetes bacterium]|nr:PDZ domain-containing protein [Bacteroidota bacterium]MBU1372913.1 PDZ domain-containing protein [Bacteroidota bacterium]MBU1484177.1 PDZ domain-containing protein [Bacteroidota bacterium]MBU1759462.1 PDZ domain-containing protein [Bacteroidota bacterium]MBU2267404.1 PDZ domain-containing protein [Bacteroidota bacterium]
MTVKTFAQNAANIHFEVSFTEPQAHYADVKMEITNLKKDEIIVKMPVWAPGSYLVREFSKNIESFDVSAKDNSSISFEKVKKNAWKINTKGKNSITVSYRVYAFEISVRTSFVDASHAFLSPTGIFMFVDGGIADASMVTIIPYKTWSKVSTGLAPIAGGKAFTYYAKNFDWLFDSPIEVGNQDVFEFNAAGVRHEVAMVGGGNYDKEKLKVDMAKLVEKESAIFGENPNKHYVFIVHNYQSGSGGLEHQNSTVLGAKRMGYDDPKTYKSFMGLVAHEYFHLWNVKRLRPIALGPFDYDIENYTTNLWIAEGFTAYYDNLIVSRAGLDNPEGLLGMIEADINAIYNSQGNKVQPLSEASFDAWIKYYRPNENSGNTTVSYYNKGSLIAVMLDLAIIHHSKGAQSLDDAMRFAYNEYYKKKGRGYTDAEMKAVFEKYSGENLDQFYNDYINGTKQLDMNKYMNYAGLELVDQTRTLDQPYLGVVIESGNKIKNVSRGSSAWNDGLNVNDEILAINGERVNDVLESVSEAKVNEKLNFMISRDGIIQNIEVTIKAAPNKSWKIRQMDRPNQQQKAVLEKWLSL